MSGKASETQKRDVSLKGARATERDPALRASSPQGSHSEGQFRPPASTRRESLGESIRVKLPAGLRHDVEEIVECLGLWPNLAEFIRDAIRDKRDRWIEEARLRKKELAGSEARAGSGEVVEG
jgi:Arc/MetJ-type ribon-helix-helix transcriptional regulator